MRGREFEKTFQLKRFSGGFKGHVRTLRWLTTWARARPDKPTRGVVTEDVRIGRGEEAIRARRHRPARGQSPRPGWVILHGATIPGPDHLAIARLAVALAGAGAVVLVPEVREWRQLRLDPAPALAVLRLVIDHLSDDPGVRSGGVVLVGTSFGCPQTLITAADPALRGHVRGVLGFGTYHSLADTVRFGLTGQFEWRGRTEYLRPDPYGRWVVASNYLHRIPGYEEAEDVSRALGELATLAGQHGIMSWEPSSDPFKERVLASVSPGNRGLFRLFAPVAAREPDPILANELAPLLAEAGRATHPGLELRDSLPSGVLPPVRLIHGRHDHLIPFTETLALERFLRKRADVTATVTDLFAHSKGSGRRVARPGEAVRFLAAIRGALGLDGA